MQIPSLASPHVIVSFKMRFSSVSSKNMRLFHHIPKPLFQSSWVGGGWHRSPITNKVFICVYEAQGGQIPFGTFSPFFFFSIPSTTPNCVSKLLCNECIFVVLSRHGTKTTPSSMSSCALQRDYLTSISFPDNRNRNYGRG